MSGQIKFYTDEHIPSAVVEGLRRRGIDVLTTSEAGMLGALDEAQLTLATEHERVIFTQDDDFLKLHAGGIEHSGIIYVHQGELISSMVRDLHFIYHLIFARIEAVSIHN
jgi:predicted nuclease of predicted toxin-antitoxin system